MSESNRITAAAAKQLASRSATRDPDVTDLLNRVYSEISKAANQGQLCLDRDPLVGLRMPVTDRMRELVWKDLTEAGFVVRTGKRFLISWK